MITYFTNVLHLNDTLGCSPQFYDPRLPIIFDSSLYNLYIEQVIPSVVYNYSLPGTQYFITNTATLRYPLFEGHVVVNDIYAIIPFIDTFVYYPNLNGTQLNALLVGLRELYTPSLKMTPYFETYEKPDLTRPAYTHSLQTVDPDVIYDVVCSAYDSDTITDILAELYGTYVSISAPYPTYYSSTSALAAYVVTEFPCTPGCGC